MGEPGRFQALLRWWRDLPAPWRVNVGLYALAGISLVALLSQIVIGGGSAPRRIEVATQTTRPRTATTLSTTTTLDQSTTSVPASVPPTNAPPPTPGPAPKTASTAKGKAATGGGGSPAPVTFNPTTTQAVRCQHNSVDPACGPFSWDPPPGENQGLDIELVSISPEEPRAGQAVTVGFLVKDPDHLVTGNCSTVTFGDGGSQGSCPPLACEDAHGVWDARAQPGSNEITFDHIYASPGTFHLTATFHTDRDRCPDPYGSAGEKTIDVTVTE